MKKIKNIKTTTKNKQKNRTEKQKQKEWARLPTVQRIINIHK